MYLENVYFIDESKRKLVRKAAKAMADKTCVKWMQRSGNFIAKMVGHEHYVEFKSISYVAILLLVLSHLIDEKIIEYTHYKYTTIIDIIYDAKTYIPV